MKQPAPAHELFTRTHAIRTCLRVEAALALAQADAGAIPLAAAEEIAQRCDLANISMDRIWEDTERTGYPIPPLVRQITNACSKEAGQYVHWGATTMDILDTALTLQLRDALAHVETRLTALVAALSDLALKYRETVMAARTFGGHALPITFGFKAAVWLAPVCRHLARVREVRARVTVCELGGAAGTLASMGTHASAILEHFARRIELDAPVIAWHTARDYAAETVCLFGLITASLAKIAGDISQLSSTEIAEVFEPASGGRDTSSTLPQKTNPIYSGQIMACASLLAQHSALALQAVRQQHERSSEGFIEFAVLPDAFAQTLRALDKSIHVLQGLRVDPARMRENLKLTRGQIMSEAVMMALAPKMGRLVAHDVLHEACAQASRENRELIDTLKADPRIAGAMNESELSRVLDPLNYLGRAREAVDDVLRAAREAVGG